MPTFIACLGDSITEGAAADVPYPLVLANLIGGDVVVSNQGVSGAQVAAMTGRWREVIYGKGHSIVCLLGGVNDVVTGSRTAAQAWTDLQALYDEIRGAGRFLIACTVLPCGNYSGWSSGKQTELETLNASITTYCGSNSVPLVDGYGEFGAVSPEDLAAAYDSGDGLHLSTAGAALLANLFFAELP